jgi:hypothetical protein
MNVSLTGYGGTLAVGAQGVANLAGSVYTFGRTGKAWIEQSTLVAPNGKKSSALFINWLVGSFLGGLANAADVPRRTSR